VEKKKSVEAKPLVNEEMQTVQYSPANKTKHYEEKYNEIDAKRDALIFPLIPTLDILAVREKMQQDERERMQEAQEANPQEF
jgi:hypothetical protein